MFLVLFEVGVVCTFIVDKRNCITTEISKSRLCFVKFFLRKTVLLAICKKGISEKSESFNNQNSGIFMSSQQVGAAHLNSNYQKIKLENMAQQQTNQSFQNDGNFNLLDLKDINFKGPTMRIETYRASHPSDGEFSKTIVGTKAIDLTGNDYLKPESNQVFRHIFSVENFKTKEQVVTLEFREKFYEDGSWDIKMRDVDYLSNSYGAVAVCNISPCRGKQKGNYELKYQIINPDLKNTNNRIISPLPKPISKIDSKLKDISSENAALGKLVIEKTIYIGLNTPQIETESLFSDLSNILSDKKYSSFITNVIAYQRFGDFRDKCIHTGQNLIGTNRQLASEYMLVRPYRSGMIIFARLFDSSMAKKEYLRKGFSLWTESNPINFDHKPGVYTVFILSYILNIEIYQLGLDKVHSDYGGIPMKLKPGSKLETGIDPIKSAFRANRTLAEIAVAFYEPYIASLLK